MITLKILIYFALAVLLVAYIDNLNLKNEAYTKQDQGLILMEEDSSLVFLNAKTEAFFVELNHEGLSYENLIRKKMFKKVNIDLEYKYAVD